MGLFGFIKRLFKAAWLGLDTLRRVLHLILLLGLFVVLLAGAGGQPVVVPASGALVVNPTGMLVEQLEGSPFDRVLAEAQGSEPMETLLPDVIDGIGHATGDPRIKAIVLELDGLEGGGLPKLQALARALTKFRESGKKVIAVGGGYTRDQYYLAAHADEVLMHPLGLTLLEGYEYYRTFFRGALEKLRVDVNVFKVGEYKSFVEPFIRDDMSQEDREASQRWVNALWGTWQRDVASARKLEAAALDAYANGLPALIEAAGGNAGKVAVDARLVDRLMTRTESDAYIAGVLGEEPASGGGYTGIAIRDYVRSLTLEQKLLRSRDRNVGVVVAAGEIVDGEAPPGTIGGDSLAAQLRDAAADDSIVAVVLRIDSPGGSMFASDVVLDEVEALQAAGKPVVASMSSVAASGGYYIAMGADRIFASEATITGSIGVGALVPTVQRGLEALGVHVDGFGTTALAGQFRVDRALGADARRLLSASIEDAYRIFVGKVADAREMDAERADGVARGRVWIGSDARDLGLVDEIGGIDEAIAAAAGLAGLEEGSYGLRYVQPQLSWLDRLLMRGLGTGVRAAAALGFRPSAGGPVIPGPLGAELARLAREARAIAAWNDPRGIYAHCLCGVD
jgi:protease-4